MNKRKSVSRDDLPAGACLVEVSSDGGSYYILPVYQQLIAALLHPKCLGYQEMRKYRIAPSQTSVQ